MCLLVKKLTVLWLLSVVMVIQAVQPTWAQSDDVTCLSCHEDPDLTGTNRDGLVVPMFVPATVIDSSAHAGMACIDCHQDLAAVEEYPHEGELQLVNCGTCHAEEDEVYQQHGRVKVGEDVDIPTCTDCHGTHDIFPSTQRNSLVNPLNLPNTCGRCHEDIDLTTKHEIRFGHPVTVYESSIHGRAAEAGVDLSASCNDCHSSNGNSHRIFSPGNPESSINHFNIPKTCGKCHAQIEQEFWSGIHGKLVARGETDAPVCTHCHGEHGIISPSDPRARVSPTRVAEATCAPCHESAYLNEKFKIPGRQLRTWYDSYHGFKSRAGDITVANCASCHGAHLILPHTDPRSSIYPDNLQRTCGNCHPGISAAIAATPIHETPGISTPAALVIKNIYIVAIFVIIGAMVVHWLIDLRKQIHLVRIKKQIRRMTHNEVWQHWLLMITFIVLVITGFSLRYSRSWWVDLLFGWEGGFPLRGVIHRVAAVLFTLTTVWHVIYLSGKRGRQFLRDMWPTATDFKQFFQMIAFNLGFKVTKPIFGRFCYIEKAEYWALVWGAVVMIITGFFLWFDNVAVQWFPKGFLDVMLVIHYYEAWLAFLAILIWHMYSTIFSPTVYPMNPSWIDGKMPLEMYKHEHAGDPELQRNTEQNSSNGSMRQSDQSQISPSTPA
ncbi:MAG: cytochrome c3 family protein [Candidatus Zixiibacteriota bacterium]